MNNTYTRARVKWLNSLSKMQMRAREVAEFSFENADVRSICHCKQKMKSKLELSSECDETKLCKPGTSLTSHLHSSCGMVWHRTLRLK